MYVIISIIKIQPVTVVEAWEIISLFVCAQTNTSVLSSCLQQKFKVWEPFVWAVKCSVMLSFAGSLSTHWSTCAGASAQGSQGADCSSCFWVQGSLFCQVSTICVSKVRPRCFEVWISELWRFMARTLVYSSRYFQWKQVIRHNLKTNNEPWRGS